MTTYKQGDVVLVPFPFTDLRATKQRPAAVISANWFNRLRNDCVLGAISSQLPQTVARDELLLSATDLTSAGLPKASIVKLGKIFTAQQSLIVKSLGQIPSDTLAKILSGVRAVLTT